MKTAALILLGFAALAFLAVTLVEREAGGQPLRAFTVRA